MRQLSLLLTLILFYCSVATHVLQGKLSCLHRGMNFCKSQLHYAISKFEETTHCSSFPEEVDNSDVVEEETISECSSSDGSDLEELNVPSYGVGDLYTLPTLPLTIRNHTGSVLRWDLIYLIYNSHGENSIFCSALKVV